MVTYIVISGIVGCPASVTDVPPLYDSSIGFTTGYRPHDINLSQRQHTKRIRIVSRFWFLGKLGVNAASDRRRK
jgi:hypothetical protein